MIRFACPECKKVYKAPDEYAGKKTACKKCGVLIVIPERPVREFVYGVSLPPEGTVEASEEPELPRPAAPERRSSPPPSDPPRRRKRKRRPQPHSDRDDDEPIRSGRPWQANAVGGMLIGGGAWAAFASLLGILVFPLVCFWPGLYFAIVWAVFAIIRGAGLLGERWRAVNPKTVAVLQIVQAVNLDVVNVALGIVSLVFLNQMDAQRRYRAF